jgi:hypothetical protein
MQTNGAAALLDADVKARTATVAFGQKKLSRYGFGGVQRLMDIASEMKNPGRYGILSLWKILQSC